jgi:hypothetical protein
MCTDQSRTFYTSNEVRAALDLVTWRFNVQKINFVKVIQAHPQQTTWPFGWFCDSSPHTSFLTTNSLSWHVVDEHKGAWDMSASQAIGKFSIFSYFFSYWTELFLLQNHNKCHDHPPLALETHWHVFSWVLFFTYRLPPPPLTMTTTWGSRHVASRAFRYVFYYLTFLFSFMY